jgi:hypothetical protein
MRWLHVEPVDTLMWPRTGLFVQCEPTQFGPLGPVVSLTLVVALKVGRPCSFTYDYGAGTRIAKPAYWARLTWDLPSQDAYSWTHRYLGRLNWARGVGAADSPDGEHDL